MSSAEVDIPDCILIDHGKVTDWFFTSRESKQVQRKKDDKLNPVEIKKAFVRTSQNNRHCPFIAILLHESSDGGISAALLRDLEFNLVLCQSSSKLWMSSFLLQPYVEHGGDPNGHFGSYVGKYNAQVTHSSWVLKIPTFQDLELSESPSNGPTRTSASIDSSADVEDRSTSSRTRLAASYKASIGRRRAVPKPMEDILLKEISRILRHLEKGFQEKVQQCSFDFLVTSNHRLVLLRVTGLVFLSDVQVAQVHHDSKRDMRLESAHRQQEQRGEKAPSACAGRRFCKCRVTLSPTRPATSGTMCSSYRNRLYQMPRRSVHLSEAETEYLRGIGAVAEAHLQATSSSASAGVGSPESSHTFARLLERRVFILKSTLWNPKSKAFNPNSVALSEGKSAVHQYDMVYVCRTCHVVYQTVDEQRFQATQQVELRHSSPSNADKQT